jgi:flagellin
MTIQLSPERTTLSLPGARSRSDLPTLRAGPNGVVAHGQPARENAVSLGRGVPADGAGLAAATSQLDRASSIADAGLAAISALVEQLNQLRDAAGEGASSLLDRLRRMEATVEQGSFDGVNLIGGGAPEGLKVAAGPGDDGLVVRGYDLRPGGPVISVDPDAEPTAVATQAEASQSRAESVRQNLQEDAKRVEAHRTFLGFLSDAVSGPGQSLDIDGARLAALSVKQTIGGTTLPLSGGAPQTVLSLFR